jgi:hypothetical protein
MNTTDADLDRDTEDVAVPYQPSIAVRGDEKGNVSIRQHGMQEDQFLDISRVHVISVCRAILREAGLHQLTIAPLDYVHLRDGDGNLATVKASQSLALVADFEKLDRIAEEERLDRLAGRAPCSAPLDRSRRIVPPRSASGGTALPTKVTA